MNIKERAEELYKIIADAEKELEDLREYCTHTKTFEGDYMWAPGHIDHGLICEDCHKYIKSLPCEYPPVKTIDLDNE